MKALTTKSRLLVCAVIIIAFFVPAYDGISGFSYISFAFKNLEGQTEITTMDVWVTIIPLLLIPISAAAILVRSYYKLSTRKTYMFLPAVCFGFFTVILFFSQKSGGAVFSGRVVLMEMTIGFYLTAIGCAILPFTKTPRRRKSEKPVSGEMEMAL